VILLTVVYSLNLFTTSLWVGRAHYNLHIGEGRKTKSHKSIGLRTCEKLKSDGKASWGRLKKGLRERKAGDKNEEHTTCHSQNCRGLLASHLVPALAQWNF
jgi:hypothetical protein